MSDAGGEDRAPDEPRSVDLAAATGFLADRYSDRAHDVAPAGRGEWSIAYAFGLDGNDYVVRFGRERDDFGKDRFAASFASPDLPIPAVIEIGEAFGAFYAISERVEGVFLEDLSADGMRATLPSLFGALDAAREADVSAYSGYGLWDATGNALHESWRDALLAERPDGPSERIPGWRDRLAGSRTGFGPFDEAQVRMRELVDACPPERHLLHGDTLNRNIFVRGGRISGIIDWGCGMYGDFLYDVAYTDFWRPWYPAWRDVDLAAEAERHYRGIGVAVPEYGARMRCYALHVGLDAMIYSAFLGRWPDLERIAAHTLEIARGS